MTIAALIVTHQSEPWLAKTLRSVLEQSKPVDRVVLVDDASSDGTLRVARELVGSMLEIVPASASSANAMTRIAANFQRGLQACRACDAVVLGDHDDLWLPTRVEHQTRLLDASTAQMVASDGRLVDEAGAALGPSLRTNFPIPATWWSGSASDRMRIALRWSIATGGASAVRPAAFADMAIPAGWLHDRWWSLLATARERMHLDPEVVIDYRVSEAQQVGLGRGRQDARAARRFLAAIAGASRTWRRLGDVRSGLAQEATSATAPELRGLRLLRNLA